jgi:hypothetical protein
MRRLVPSLVLTLAILPATATGQTSSLGTDVLRVDPDDPLTPRSLEWLERSSPTGRDLLRRISQLQHTVLIARANPVLMRSLGAPGRTTLWSVNGRVYGLVEYQAQTAGSISPVCILAHELAHVLEIAAALDGTGFERLGHVLAARDISAEPRFAQGIETEFATAVGRRVRQELRHQDLRTRSVLDEIAAGARIAVHGARERPAPALAADRPEGQGPTQD